MKHWYHVQNIEEIDSPALLIYENRVAENIRLLIGMIDDVARLRPHVKTHKTTEAVSLQLAVGITKFKCATIAEAEMLAITKAPDVLLAYQPAGPKLKRFVSLIEQYQDTKFSCLVDNIASATSIDEAAAEHKLVIPVFIDLNVGMNRTGIVPGRRAVELYKHCAASNGVSPVGLHAYDGHLHARDLADRTRACNQAFELVEQTQKLLIEEGFAAPVIIAGGSPTFPIHAKRGVVECSPGTFIFWDRGYELNCPEQPFQPAALVVSRIVSLPTDNTLCLDLGHKSIASENELQKRVYFLNAPELEFIGHSEEHLVVKAPAGHLYKTGDVLYGLPYHICPTVALYERAVVVKNNVATEEWKIIARDRKISL